MLGAISVASDAASPGFERAIRSLERQGFHASFRLKLNDGLVQGWSLTPGHGSSTLQDTVAEGNHDAVRTRDGAACVVGTLWYRGAFGNAALRLLLDEFDLPSGLDEASIRGTFVLVLCKGGRAWMLNDPMGLARVYSSAKFDFHCTSWLATRAFNGSPEIDQGAAAEYVLLGAVHGDDTVAQGVSKLPLGLGIDLSGQRTWNRFPKGLAEVTEPFESAGAAVEAVAPMMRVIFRDAASAFPDRISAALSGGFDSRLILAGVLDQGVRPRLFVYGEPGSLDVQVAQAVALAEGLPLEVVDKTALDRTLPAPDVDELVRAALFFDGLPNDGILDPGADRRTRLAQVSGGFLALNGGGGEIFRNFFHLPDRPLGPRDVVRAFYRAFDPAVFRRHGALENYEERLADSMVRTMAVAGASADHLPGRRFARSWVELLYPLFRCHHWMGLNNSVAIRRGYFHTPLMELATVRLACRIPLRWKDAGQFQSNLITALNFDVASHASAYGFAFCKGPGPGARFAEWSTRHRPVTLRPFINAAGRRLRGSRASPVTIAYCRNLLPGEWQIDSSLDLSRLPDDAALARALAIEIAARALPP